MTSFINNIPPFDYDHLSFWIGWPCFFFYTIIMLSQFRFWWVHQLPREKHLKRKNLFWAFLFILRVDGLGYLIRVALNRYGDKIYDFFLLAFTGLVVFAPKLLWMLIVMSYRYITDTKRYLAFFNKYFDKYFTYYIVYSTKISIFIRPYFSYLFARYGFLFELPALFYESAFVQGPFLIIKIYFLIITVLLVICGVYIVLNFFWLFWYKYVYTKIVLYICGVVGLKFPRLAISSSPTKVLTSTFLKNRKQLTVPIFVKLKTLVDLQHVNLWNSTKSVKIKLLTKKKRYRIKQVFKTKIRSGIKSFYSTTGFKAEARLHNLASKIFNRAFLLKHVSTKGSKLNVVDLNSQMLLPQVFSLCLDNKTLLAKHAFLKQQAFKTNKLFRLEKSLFVLNTAVFGKFSHLPFLSNFFKQVFFKTNQFQLFCITNNKKKVSSVFDSRYIFLKKSLSGRRIQTPKFYIRSNFNFNITNYTDCFQNNLDVSVFLKRRRIRNYFHKTLLKREFKFFKTQKLLSLYSIRLRWLLQKGSRKEFLQFTTEYFNALHRLDLSFNYFMVLRRFLLILRRLKFKKPKIYLKKKRIINLTQFIRFFYFVIKNRRYYKSTNKNIFFFHRLNGYNYKFLLNLKYTNNNLHYLPFVLTFGSPWWSSFSSLTSQVLSKSSNFKLNYNQNYYLSFKIFAKRIVSPFKFRGVNYFTNAHNLTRRLFLNRERRFKKNKYIKKKKLILLMFGRKSRRLRFFFDRSLYYKKHNLNLFFIIKNRFNTNRISNFKYSNGNKNFFIFFIISGIVFYLFIFDFFVISF